MIVRRNVVPGKPHIRLRAPVLALKQAWEPQLSELAPDDYTDPNLPPAGLPGPPAVVSVASLVLTPPTTRAPDDADPWKGLQHDGDFRLKKDLLGQLPHYMRFLARMKSGDRESYDLYRQVGLPITPDKFAFWGEDVDRHTIPPWFMQTLPSFGGVTMAITDKLLGDDVKRNMISPRFLYFMKYQQKGLPLVLLQPLPNVRAVYLCTIYYDDAKRPDEKYPVPVQYGIALTNKGEMIPLKVFSSTPIDLPYSKKRKQGSVFKDMSRWEPPRRMEWNWPWAIRSIARENGSTPEKCACDHFAFMVHGWEMMASTMVRVTATKGEITAAFGVDVTKTPRFFDDREQVVVDGVKKRIFHAVRPHSRDLGNKAADVKMHFRGLRQFAWNGYHIAIAVPGRDHVDYREFNVPGLDETHRDPSQKYIETEELGAKISAAMQPPSPTQH